MYLTEGHFNFKAVRVQDETKEGVLVYRDCDLSDAAVLALHVKSERGGSVEAFVDGVSMGSFTRVTQEPASSAVLRNWTAMRRKK